MTSLPDQILPADLGAPYLDADAVVDPETELAASDYNALVSCVSALSFVAPLAVLRCNAAGAIQAYRSVFGDDVSVRPTVTKSATGVYEVVWAATYNSLLVPTPEVKAINVAAAFSDVTGAGDTWSKAVIRSAVRVDVLVFDDTATAVDEAFCLMVF